MKLWSWYAHSWYPGSHWEVGFDLRRWMLGWFYNGGAWQVMLGPAIISWNGGW